MKKVILLALGASLMSNLQASDNGALAAAIGFSALSNIGTTAALANSNRGGGDSSYALQRIDQVKDAAREDLERLNDVYKRRFRKMRNAIMNLRKRVRALENKAGVTPQEAEGSIDE